jgi:hypothetical protein
MVNIIDLFVGWFGPYIILGLVLGLQIAVYRSVAS